MTRGRSKAQNWGGGILRLGEGIKASRAPGSAEVHPPRLVRCASAREALRRRQVRPSHLFSRALVGIPGTGRGPTRSPRVHSTTNTPQAVMVSHGISRDAATLLLSVHKTNSSNESEFLCLGCCWFPQSNEGVERLRWRVSTPHIMFHCVTRGLSKTSRDE